MANVNDEHALNLVRSFIWLEREYRKTRDPELIKKLHAINDEYIAVNGGGDLFSTTHALDLRSQPL